MGPKKMVRRIVEEEWLEDVEEVEDLDELDDDHDEGGQQDER